jgi:hypothetical protein
MDTGNDQTGQSGAINVLNEKVQGRLSTQLNPLRPTMKRPIVRVDTKMARSLLVDEVFSG